MYVYFPGENKNWAVLAYLSLCTILMGFAVRVRSAGRKIRANVPPKGPCWRHRVCHLAMVRYCRRLGSTFASWRWQDINVGNPLWRRALLWLYTELEFCQMENGYTKCLVDGRFGRIKQLYRRYVVYHAGADLGILVGGGGVDIICDTYNLSATPFLQISLSAG